MISWGRRVAKSLMVLTVIAGVGVAAPTMSAVASTRPAHPTQADWSALRMCESSNRYDAVADTGHYGAYQFDLPTWRSVGGTGLPSEASPTEQDARALALYAARGWQPWTCAAALGLGATPAAAPASPPWPGKVFRHGDCDPALRTWQLQMNRWGYGFVGTGCYFARTARAVLDLQRINGLPTSGLLGPKTWQAAWAGAGPMPEAVPAAPAGPAVPAAPVLPAAPALPAGPAVTPTATPPAATPTTTPPTTRAAAAPTSAPAVTPPASSPSVTTPGPAPVAPAVEAGGAEAAAALGWGTPTAGDEFDVPGAPDARRWRTYSGAGYQGAGSYDPKAVRVAGGALVLTGDTTGSTGGVAAVAGASYGRWEARIAVPAGDRQYDPVALLWPDGGDWPCAGEIDFAETGADRSDVDFFLHHSCTDEQVTTRTPVALAQWHNYAVDWSPTCVVGYVDAVETFRDCTEGHSPSTAMHLALQLGYYPDGGAAPVPTTMAVDWVRYYPPAAD